MPSLESIAAERRQSKSLQAAHNDQSHITKPEAPTSSDLGDDAQPPRTPQEYENEAGEQGAFNPETGEINWDCPCLGGMAHGPCGPEFRAAFSCFVFSKEEPKGMDCIDRFK